MNAKIEDRLNTATEKQVAIHLLRCDADFVPPLSSRVEINDYAKKISANATKFEAWVGRTLVGLVAAYCNDATNRIAHITSVSVLRAWTGKGIASHLLGRCIEHAKMSGMRRLTLEVAKANLPAVTRYKKNGFLAEKSRKGFVSMSLSLEDGTNMKRERDYNVEIKDTADHKYAYDFDFDVMHPFMIRSFAPFFKNGNMLELGSFKGDFTGRLLPYFDDLTCVEASGVAIANAKRKLGNKAKFIHSPFEKAKLPKRYNNIMLTHVLEHLDDPALVLKRINDEWLTRDGRCFVACPNANAPSRQIAVKMGLITHNCAVTPAEAEHGHRRTYTLDTLERDAVTAGLRVIHRSGIFFKALANFQWDRLLQTDIVSSAYLEGCYKLGQQYPDLCASIFLVCEQGK